MRSGETAIIEKSVFERIKRALSGIADPEAAYRWCATSFDNACANFRSMYGDDTPFRNFFEDDAFRTSFYAYLKKTCDNCLTVRDASSQLINLRKAIINCADEKIIAEAYLSASGEDRQILSDRVFTERTKAENDLFFVQQKEFNTAAVLVLRGLSHEYFKDMKLGDWYKAYEHVAKVVYESKLQAAVYKSKGDTFVVESLLPALEAKREEILEIVHSGGNLDVDPEWLDQLSEEDEEIKPESQKKKRAAVYADEIDKIVDILWNRFQAISTGKLYVLDEFVPKDLFHCFVMDVALVWTVLAENLENPEQADSYIAEIAGRALERSGVETSGNQNFEGLLRTAKMLVEKHIESDRKAEKWIPDHMISAFSFIYGVTIEDTPAKTERNRAIGYMAAGLGTHVWPLFADVSNVLGHDYPRKWIGEPD